MMNAIFSDNKIIDPNSTTQQVSLRNLPMAPQLPLRMSCSPLKMPTTKKFFFPGRNRSSKQDDSKSRIELDNLLKREKIMLLAQKSQFNELLFTPNMFLKESELLAFPSLEVKQVNYNEARKSK